MPEALGVRPQAGSRQAGGPLDRSSLALGHVGAAGVEALVARDEVGPVGAQPAEEDLAHRPAQEQRLAADRDGARLGRELDDPLDLLGRVVDPGHQRRDQDAGRDPGPVERAHRLEPRARVRRVRLARTPRLLVERRDREARADLRTRGDLPHQVEIAQQQRRLRQDRAGVRRVAQRLPDPAHQLVAALDPLVRVGVRPQRDVLALPRRPRELRPQHLGHVDLDDDLLLEVPPGVEVEVLVRRAREAVVADDSVGDEVAGSGRDVVERELHAERLDARPP